LSDQLLVKIEDHICTLTINRPEKRNSLSPDLLEELLAVMEELKAGDEARVVVIRGAGDKAFCAGYDISSIPTSRAREDNSGQNLLEMSLNSVYTFPYPVIGMLNGFTVGAGLDLSANCDLRIACDTAMLALPRPSWASSTTRTGCSGLSTWWARLPPRIFSTPDG